MNYQKISLIEYAAFCGAPQIFNYLLSNGSQLDQSICFFSIHGQNAEIIQLLEDENVKLDKYECLNESIKCHHNESYFIFF